MNQVVTHSANFLLLVYSKNPTFGFLLQSFNISQLLKLYPNFFTCQSNIDPRTFNEVSNFLFYLNCSFINNHYTDNYFETLVIGILFLNSSELLQFSTIYPSKNQMFLDTTLSITGKSNLNSTKAPLNYSIRNLAALNDQFRYDNSSLVDIIQNNYQIDSFNNVYSPWPFYLLIFSSIILLVLFRRNKLRHIANDQIS